MTESVIIAAPLLIAAILMAVRFVGCSFDPSGYTAETPYSTTILSTPNLVSFWRLNDQSDPTAVDSKDGNNGSYHGGVTLLAQGLVSPDSQDTDNFGAQFDGQTGYVEVPFAANLNPPLFTVEVLVAPSGNNPNEQVIVVSEHRLSAGPQRHHRRGVGRRRRSLRAAGGAECRLSGRTALLHRNDVRRHEPRAVREPRCQ